MSSYCWNHAHPATTRHPCLRDYPQAPISEPPQVPGRLAGGWRGIHGPGAAADTRLSGVIKSSFSTSEKPTPLQDVTHYNNYYEFGTGKEQPADLAKTLRTSPWTVTVEGAVNKPKIFDIDEIMKIAPLEERIYRHRCVEAWSIVVPWIGFPLNALIKQVEPTSKAKFVAFQTLYDPKQMPAGRYAGIPLPYVEGLRMDEAMHPLTLSCAWAFMARCCPTRTARRFAWWCRGNTGSRASSPS